MKSLLKALTVAVLVLALSVQVFQLVKTYGTRTVEIYKSIGQTGSWRGANFAFSQEAADFYSFLNSKIPPTSVVVVQAGSTPEAFSRKGYVEFFLWPRAIRFCYDAYDDCIQDIKNTDHAILITDLQSVSSPDEYGERFQSFNSNWGVFLPSPGAINAVSPHLTYGSFQEIGAATIPPMALLAALILPGALIGRTTLPKENWLLHLSLGIGSGLGWLSLSLFLAIWLGATISGVLILGLALFYWAIAGTSIFLYGKKTRGGKAALPPRSQTSFIVAFLLIPILWAGILSIGNAYSHTDEIVLWGAKGYGIAAVGLQEGVTERGTLTTQYPLNIPLSITSFLTLFGERLPESKLIFPLYFLGLISLIFVFLQRYTRAWTSVVGSLLIATTPFIFFLATMAHANLPFTFYLIGGCLLLHQAQQTKISSNAYWVWGVVFLTLAAWTRPEGIYLAVAIAGAALAFYRHHLDKEKMKVVWLVGGLGLYFLFWFFAAQYAYFKSGFTSGVFSTALSQVLQGNLHFSEALFILQSMSVELFNTMEWGTMGWLIVIGVVLFAARPKLPKRDFSIAGFGMVILLAVFAGYLANSYSAFQGMDISGWLETGLMRVALPGLILIWLQFTATISRHFFPSGNELNEAT